VLQYTKKSDKSTKSPAIKYFDASGFPLEDILKANEKIMIDESQPDFFEIINRYSKDIEFKLRSSLKDIMDPNSYRIKVIADIKHDVTLNTYSPKQIFFFARFSYAETDYMKTTRIQYKRIANFNEERGDEIHFYNFKPHEFALLDSMTKEMEIYKNSIQKETKTQTVLFEPIDLSQLQVSNFSEQNLLKSSPVMPAPSVSTQISTPTVSGTIIPESSPTTSLTPVPSKTTN
jgi:hypothetical protein